MPEVVSRFIETRDYAEAIEGLLSIPLYLIERLTELLPETHN